VSADPKTEPLPYAPREIVGALGEAGPSTLDVAFRWMVLGRTLDTRMLALQRQGRVGFYGPATGQEAVNVGAGLASAPEDWIFPGLREQLVALVRGHRLTTYVHHLFADAKDPSRGRNMPCHPSAREVRYVSMSSVIGTQVSQAVGTAFAMRRRGDRGVALAFFGDGATSANDVHAGMNFAAVLSVPVLFCCTNNQWAISVPVERQAAVRTLVERARAYGMAGQRVDGTDVVAVLAAVRLALARLRAGGPPEMLEFVLFRQTPHSSSDDPSRYQPAGWAKRAIAHDPLARLEAWLLANGRLDAKGAAAVRAEAEASVRAAIEEAEATPPPPLESLTEDVLAPARSVSPTP
jgi:pyruvate dehydrogenase E1 component alpha subunit